MTEEDRVMKMLEHISGIVERTPINAAGRRQYGESDKRTIVKAWQQSDMTQAEFCDMVGLKGLQSMLSKWVRQQGLSHQYNQRVKAQSKEAKIERLKYLTGEIAKHQMAIAELENEFAELV